MMPNDCKPITPAEAAEFLRTGERYLLVLHSSPDADTIGSAEALRRVLTACGKEVCVMCGDPIPPRYHFLTGDVCRGFDALPADFAAAPYTIVTVDVASLALTGKAADALRGRVALKIDHHPIGEDFAPLACVDTEAAACAEVIYAIADALGIIDTAIATALYTAISGDSGCFRYSCTTPRTHRIAAALIEAGADHDDIDRRLFSSRTAGELAAMRMQLCTMRFFCGGTVALTVIDNDIKTTYGLCDDDLEELASFPMTFQGIHLSVTLKQKEGDTYKVSMRSGPEIACNELCRLLGGGGHVRAAGASVTAPDSTAAAQIVMDTVLTELGKAGLKNASADR